MNILDFLESNVARHGAYPKLVFRDQVWSSVDLLENSKRIAGVLRALGVVRGDRVSVALPMTLLGQPSIAGIFRIGAIVAPIHFDLATEETMILVSRLKPKIIITTAEKAKAIAGKVGDVGVTFLTVDSVEKSERMQSLPDLMTSFKGKAPGVEDMKPNDPALIISTGGTTGTPKSTVLSHGNWTAQMQNGIESDHLKQSSLIYYQEDDCVHLEVGSYGHVGPLLGLIRSWVKKTKVVIMDKTDNFLELIEKYKPTSVATVPTLFEQMAANPQISKYDFSSVKIWSCGMAAMTEERQNYIENKLGIKIIVNYGTAECCGIVTTNALDSRKFGGSGRPLKGVKLKLVDDNGNEVAQGEEGEVWIQSATVGLGYYDNPEVTKKAFVDGWYRTGDLAKIDKDGHIFIQGRKALVINQGGYKIQPMEVQRIVETAPAVATCVVTAIPDDLMGHVVGVFIQVRKGMTFNAAELTAHCAKFLSEQKIPRKIYVVEKFPLTASAKVDTVKLLKDRDLYEVTSGATVDLPTTPAERLKLIKDILCVILGVDPKSLNEKQPLMEAGITSLMAVTFASKLGAALGKKVPSTLIFNYPTINEIAGYISDTLGASIRKKSTAQKKSTASMNEPIAIVGMSCRFPGGVTDPESFWDFLYQGKSGISKIPVSRFPIEKYFNSDSEATGKIYIKDGYFLNDVDKFDRNFFDLSPLEALITDPQHRILLESSWEAFEDAGFREKDLMKARGGVYVGILANEYREIMLSSNLGEEMKPAAYAGSSLHSVPSRISYAFGLQGPAMPVMTTCSSSLVALDIASKDLRTGACDFALAGGVNLLLTPDPFIMLSRMGALAPDGKCKTFDASADGFARGEGVAFVVLKILSKAQADGDRIWAVVRGSSVNQNGRTSSPSAPNGFAQEMLLEDALSNANVSASDISYLEAHGTGTKVGDPIEIQAVANVYGAQRPRENVLTLGSVKTNIGHGESIAGTAGLIKTVMAMRHKTIPPHLHFSKLNPMIGALENIPAQIPTKPMEWKPINGKRMAGVSSFGMSGTNAHVILEEYIDEVKAKGQGPDIPVLTISAKSKASLMMAADNYERYLVTTGTQNKYSDICYTANCRRTQFSHRMAVVAQSHEEAHKKLTEFKNGKNPAGVVQEKAHDENSKLAFLFTGQGSQYPGMGKDLYGFSPAFKTAIDRCAEIVARKASFDLKELLFRTSERINQTEFSQPAIFCLEYALCQHWMNLGLKPEAMLGHSLGEYVAACIAEVFSLEGALSLVLVRAKLMQGTSEDGAMASLEADGGAVQKLLKKDVSIAAFNGPKQTVISGRREAVQAVMNEVQAKGMRAKALNVSHAFHSALMEPILGEIERVVGSLKLSPPKIPIISNLTGKSIGAEICRPEYWRRHLREPVHFRQSIETLLADGFNTFLEIGPSPTLSGLGQLCSGSADGLSWHWTLQKGISEREQTGYCAAGLYANGLEVDWLKWNGGAEGCRPVTLPGYAFERESFWPNVDSSSNSESQQSKVEDKTVVALVRKATGAKVDDLLRKCVSESVKNVLGIDLKSPEDWRQNLAELGMNSISAMALRRHLAQSFGGSSPLPQTLMFDHPTAEAVFEFLKSLSKGPVDLDKSRRSAKGKSNKWLRISKPKPDAKMRLFCFHFAGGAAQQYDAWSSMFGDQVEVCAIQLPGRWERSSEPLFDKMDALAEDLAQGLSGELNKPYAVFGYSFGSLTASHWLKQVAKRGDPQPVAFFTAASVPPHLVSQPKADQLRMTDDEFIEKFQNFFGGKLDDIKNNMEYRQTFLPILQADMLVVSTAYTVIEPKFKFPVHAYGGSGDSSLPLAKLKEWSKVTSAACVERVIEGGHFFIQTPAAKTMITEIAEVLRKEAAPVAKKKVRKA